MSRKRHCPRRKIPTPSSGNSGAHSLATILPSNQPTPVPTLNVMQCQKRCSCHHSFISVETTHGEPVVTKSKAHRPILTDRVDHHSNTKTLASNVKTAGPDQSAGHESARACPSWEYLQGLMSWLSSRFFTSFPLQKKFQKKKSSVVRNGNCKIPGQDGEGRKGGDSPKRCLKKKRNASVIRTRNTSPIQPNPTTQLQSRVCVCPSVLPRTTSSVTGRAEHPRVSHFFTTRPPSASRSVDCMGQKPPSVRANCARVHVCVCESLWCLVCLGDFSPRAKQAGNGKKCGEAEGAFLGSGRCSVPFPVSWWEKKPGEPGEGNVRRAGKRGDVCVRLLDWAFLEQQPCDFLPCMQLAGQLW
ncbi:uncharacterized protein B0H64DRAFT_6549 [Chaetomium fimeti]|uniref:Uncharacterized protein n=1 Tax=Chaetomium fimeti TaxID=1854472 RepID=A0AAE0LWB8_9PEZI|nr:hypothetical protein B0H64DRAFT_6549 [Chaetomium fimeti]